MSEKLRGFPRGRLVLINSVLSSISLCIISISVHPKWYAIKLIGLGVGSCGAIKHKNHKGTALSLVDKCVSLESMEDWVFYICKP